MLPFEKRHHSWQHCSYPNFSLGHPSIESSDTTRSIFGSINFFGGPLEITPKADQRLKVVEEQNDGAMFVFISDLWLDRPEVMARLKTLFLGYSKMPPTAFIFMGNFMGSTSEIGPQKSKVFKELFKSLGDLMLEREHRPLLENSKFVFVPGPNDPGFANIFPRPPLPNSLVQDLVSRIEPQFPNAVVMASNPCRIQFCTQEMVIFRSVMFQFKLFLSNFHVIIWKIFVLIFQGRYHVKNVQKLHLLSRTR